MELNKCVCGKTPGVDRWVSGYDGRMQKHRVECDCGICCPWRDIATDAIAARNDIPRAPHWTEYDGTEQTLPAANAIVYVQRTTSYGRDMFFGRVSETEDGISWFSKDGIFLSMPRVGDKWVLLPELIP